MRTLSRSEAAAMRLNLTMAQRMSAELEPKLEAAAGEVASTTAQLADVRRRRERLMTQSEALRAKKEDVNDVLDGQLQKIEDEVRNRYQARGQLAMNDTVQSK